MVTWSLLSGFLKWFDLIAQPEGFLLQYPRRKTPTELFQMPEYSKLLDEFARIMEIG